jgi:hypothetical protein
MAVPAGTPSERKVAAHFIDAEATAFTSAVSYEPSRPVRQRAFERLKAMDVIKAGDADTWWLDEARWNECRSNYRSKGVGSLLAFGVAVAAALR